MRANGSGTISELQGSSAVISDILVLLKNTVNEHLTASSGWRGPVPDQGPVVFLDSEKVDSLDLKLGAVTLLLVNLEEDHTLRPADPFRSTLADGTTQRVQPAIQMNAYVLFAARFKDYEQAPAVHLADPAVLPGPSGPRSREHTGDERQDREAHHGAADAPLSEQNQLWGVLRSSYQPSLLYKVRMVVFRDEDGLVAPQISEPVQRIHQ